MVEANIQKSQLRRILYLSELPNRLLAWLSCAMLFILMLIITIDVGGRSAAKHPLPGTVELSSYLLVLIVFLSLAYAEQHNAHLRVELLGSRLSPRGRAITDIFVFLLGFIFLGLVTWGAGSIALESMAIGEYDPGSLHLVLYPARYIIAIGSGFLSLIFLLKAIDVAFNLVNQGRS